MGQNDEKTTRITFRLPESLAADLHAEAAATGATISEVIRDRLFLTSAGDTPEARARLARQAAEAVRTVERLAMDVAAAADASVDALDHLNRIARTAA